MSKAEVAIVMSEVFLRRLNPALAPYVERHLDFRIISIHRPREELKRILHQLPVKGLMTEWLPGVTDDLLAQGLPTVIVDTDEVYPGTASIDVDDHAVGREAAQAFRSAGFTHFACLTNGTPYGAQRRDGFHAALPSHAPYATYDLEVLAETRYSEAFARPESSFMQWLAQLPAGTGIFAVHDPLGRFLCQTCASLDRRVPESLAVIGANDDELVCNLSFPRLSSVHIPWERVGIAAVEAMLALLDGVPAPTAPRLVTPGSVVLRQSANYLAVPDPLLRRAMTFLNEHLGEPLTVGSMCAQLRCARRTLERAFRVYYNCTPWEMLCRLRVQKAKLLLTSSPQSIARIAELTGFHDPERFAVVFKRVEGQTPSAYRTGSS